MTIRPSLTARLICVAALLWQSFGFAAETNTLDEHLEMFRPFLGKTWRGEFKDSKPEHPICDVSRWERALNGKAVRILHSVNNGAYGGESILFWDADLKQVRYHYFTTAGFQTTGTLTYADGKLTASEKVTGDAKGIDEVRSAFELLADGSMLSKTTYLKAGQPAGGREVHYREDPQAQVQFK